MKQRTRLMHSGDDLVAHTMGTKKDEDDGQSEIQLYRIKPQEHFIEAQIQEGDTLQAIALRFYCSISELKRINHIHKDNEIFARRTIKVPVTPYSVLTELIPVPQHEPIPSTSSETPIFTQDNLQNGGPQSKNISQTEDNHCSVDCNAVVMNSTVAPAVIPYTDTESIEHFTEDTQLLPKEKIPVEAVVVKEFTSHGADFGIKWFHLLGLVLILGIIVPILYIIMNIDKAPHPDDLPPLHTT